MESYELLREVFEKAAPKKVSADLGLSTSMIYKWSEAPDHATLFVNVFLSATLTWPARGGLTVTQTAGWPASTTSSTR